MRKFELMLFTFGLVFLSFTVRELNGHGAMVKPNSWMDHKKWLTQFGYEKFDYVGMKPGLMCAAGCDFRGDEMCPDNPEYCMTAFPGCACYWFQNFTFIERPTNLNPKLRTYLNQESTYWMRHHPWLSPGAAHLDSPCGVGGGNMRGCDGDCRKLGGYPKGSKAEQFFSTHTDYKVTNWTRGSVVEAAWGITANHGGGYSYRLCKVPVEGVSGITEECFQRTPLRFANDKQWAQYGEDESTRVEFTATRTDKGTTPIGSQWTKNPIPACRGGDGGFHHPDGVCHDGLQFPEPAPGLHGFGANIYGNTTAFKFSIIDQLEVPKNLEPGDYVLSFRWDCEQTPQVWNTCASIKLH